eukprot:3533162-Pleurochrysis_carterae.AAC.3
MDMRWTGRKLARVITVERADGLRRRIPACIQESVEGCHESSYVRRCFRLVLEKVNGFETCMVIDQDKKVLETRMLSAHERTCNVSVDETAGVGRLVQG